jgi:cytidylate kinase
MKHTPIIIAIDGPAASGKGTLARLVAERLGFAYLDTGLLYRAVGYQVLAAGGDPADPAQAEQAALAIIKKLNAPTRHNILHNQILREDHVGGAASKVAAVPAVRAALLKLQQDFAASPPPLEGGQLAKGAVLDGRDIGTVIAPEADVKLYITARPETRADRRIKELQSRGISIMYEAVLRDMLERDARDAERLSAPMRKAEGAVTIDTDDLSREQVLEKALSIIAGKIAVL